MNGFCCLVLSGISLIFPLPAHAGAPLVISPQRLPERDYPAIDNEALAVSPRVYALLGAGPQTAPDDRHRMLSDLTVIGGEEFRAALARALTLADQVQLSTLKDGPFDEVSEYWESTFNLPGSFECFLYGHTARTMKCSIYLENEGQAPDIFTRVVQDVVSMPNLTKKRETRLARLLENTYSSPAGSTVSVSWEHITTVPTIDITFTPPPKQ